MIDINIRTPYILFFLFNFVSEMTVEGVQLYELPNTHERCYRSDINIEPLNIDFVAFMFKSTILYFE